ncbi:unnamed protein product [Merluccius merluccius]
MFSWGEVDFAADPRESADSGVRFTPATKPVVTRFSATDSTVAFTKSDGTSCFLQRLRDSDGKVTFGETKSVKCSHVVDSSCGDSSLLLLSKDGVVVSVDPRASAVPRSLQNFIHKRVLQVACGDHHCIVLTEDGKVLTWGSNARGQLGLTLPDSSVVDVQSPTPVAALSGAPLVQVTAGGSHSFALSVSGTVFGWGQNDVGQLGLGDTTDRATPVTVECLHLKKTVAVSCGERHTAVLTKGGVVFTFGGGGFGQLGHNSLLNELRPRVVAELWGAAVTQISCGSNHTMAFVGPTKKIYTFGRGEEGQLGPGVTTHCSVPLPVLLPHDDQNIQRIFAGGNQSFALCTLSQVGVFVFLCLCSYLGDVLQEPEKVVIALDLDTINFWLSKCQNAKSWRKIQKQIRDIFSSASSLNASFLDRSVDKHYRTSPRCSGLDIALVSAAFEKLATKDKVLTEVEIVVRHCLLPSLNQQPVGVEGLRVYYILVELLQALVRTNHGEQLSVAVTDAFLSLHPDRLEVLVGLWCRTPTFFRSAVKNFCNVAMKHLSPLDVEYKERNKSFMTAAEVLQKLHSVSVYRQVVDAEAWVTASTGELLKTFLLDLVKYPCVLPIECKLELWQYDLKIIKQGVQLHVYRDNVLQDAFSCLRTSSRALKAPLAVTFIGEEGFDDGGVSINFFHILAKKLQEAKPQIVEVNEHGVAWFSPNVAQLTDEFFLLGTLCGMALYNRCLMNIPFPLALFKKLLGLKPSLDDLMELSPTVAQSLIELLEYEEEVVEDLLLDFGGSEPDLDLLPNGQSIPVTKVNRQKYVDLHVDMVLNRSVEYQFKEFETGFLRGCPSPVWKMFLPDQLMTLLKGEEIFNWDDLRKNAIYQDCTSDDKVVKNFWAVFAEFSVEQKKDFLKFLTGTDRLPKVRSSTIKIRIKLSCYTDPEFYYPMAETCFWTLNLPNYSNIQILRQKLLDAVECCDVFGRM